MHKNKFFFIGVLVLILILGVFYRPIFKREKNKTDYQEVMDKNIHKELEIIEKDIENLMKKSGVGIEKNGYKYTINLESGIPLELHNTEALRVENTIKGEVESIVYKDYNGEEKLALELHYYTPIKLAILIDDVGMNTSTADIFGGINKPISFATIPFLPRSAEATEKLREYGFEVILHMPMAGSSDALNSKTKGIITPDMTGEEILKRFDDAIKDVGEVAGFNNHMGSRFTSDSSKMEILLEKAKGKNMYFIDSNTNSKATGYVVAKDLGMESYYCSHFLDNSKDVEDIKKEIRTAVKMAKRDKKLLAIGHYHKNMAEALKEMTGYIESEGVKLVYAREILE